MRRGELFGRSLRPTDMSLWLVLGLMLVLTMASVVLSRGLSGYASGPSSLAIVGGLGLLGVFALTFSFYEGATVLAFALLGVARVEPAPPDMIFAALMVVAALTGRFKTDQLPSIIAVLLSVLLALNIVSFVDVVDPPFAVRFLAITAYLIALAVWLTGYARSHRRVRAIVAAYVWGAVVMSAVSAAALFVGFPGSEQFLFGGAARAQGLFKDPNVFGPFLVPAILILIEELFEPRLLKAGRFAKSIAIGVLLVGVLVSFSRAAWLNAVLAIAVLFLVHALRRGGARRAMALVSLLAIMGAALVLVVSITGSSDFIAGRAQFQSYDVGRFGAQRTGFGLVAQHPLGIGPGQFDLWSEQAAHSIYVRSLAEQGVLGFLVVVLLLVLTLFFAVRNVVYGRDTYGLGSAVLLGAWCGLLANGVFVDTLHWRHLWIVAAFIWVGAMASSAAQPERRRRLSS
jgi:O-antigen ligase